jgi:hypothetical protein
VSGVVHLHTRVSNRDYCDTVCGLHCDAVDTAYRDRDPERVTCDACALELEAPAARAELEDFLAGEVRAPSGSDAPVGRLEYVRALGEWTLTHGADAHQGGPCHPSSATDHLRAPRARRYRLASDAGADYGARVLSRAGCAVSARLAAIASRVVGRRVRLKCGTVGTVTRVDGRGMSVTVRGIRTDDVTEWLD